MRKSLLTVLAALALTATTASLAYAHDTDCADPDAINVATCTDVDLDNVLDASELLDLNGSDLLDVDLGDLF